MPLTPDMPERPDDDATQNDAKPGKTGRDRGVIDRAASRMAANDAAGTDEFDDRGGIYESDDEEDLEEAPAGQSFSDMVRQAPIGAVIGAFVAGFLVSRLI